jgi:threonine/homoserine/homoserine lactone efflux protein
LYLVWLGIHAIRHRKSLADAWAVAAEPQGNWRALRDGVVVGITNPKSYILFGAILPQFVNRTAEDVPAQMLLLAMVRCSSAHSQTAPGGSRQARCEAGSRAHRAGLSWSAARAGSR